MSLQRKLEQLAKEMGASFFGVADIRVAHKSVSTQGSEYLKRFPTAISIGIRLSDAIVDSLHRHRDPAVIFTYRGHYNAVNSRLDQIALTLALELERDGYNAYPVPASQIIDKGRVVGAISHKLAAHLAGLGWIGKSCLLITPECGPRVRFATVLTDAPLRAGSPMPDRCGECRECVDKCPSKAIIGVPFNPSEPRDARFNAHLCHEYSEKREREIGEGLCGLCVYICPYGMQTEE